MEKDKSTTENAGQRDKERRKEKRDVIILYIGFAILFWSCVYMADKFARFMLEGLAQIHLLQ